MTALLQESNRVSTSYVDLNEQIFQAGYEAGYYAEPRPTTITVRYYGQPKEVTLIGYRGAEWNRGYAAGQADATANLPNIYETVAEAQQELDAYLGQQVEAIAPELLPGVTLHYVTPHCYQVWVGYGKQAQRIGDVRKPLGKDFWLNERFATKHRNASGDGKDYTHPHSAANGLAESFCRQSIGAA